jgi:hypothetical protein
MTGTGWLTLGTQGSGDKQFNEPWGLHVDHKAGSMWRTMATTVGTEMYI